MEVLMEVQQQIRKLCTCLEQEKYPANSITTLETLLEQLICDRTWETNLFTHFVKIELLVSLDCTIDWYC